MIKNKNGGVEYRPMRQRGGADEGALPSQEARDRDSAAPIPKFKLGDRVIWKRRLHDTTIQGTGTITKVHAQAPSIHHQTGARINHFAYEIDTAALMVPGIGGYVNENLIRTLKPPKGSWTPLQERRLPHLRGLPLLLKSPDRDENILNRKRQPIKTLRKLRKGLLKRWLMRIGPIKQKCRKKK
jgi:hypothetical protein